VFIPAKVKPFLFHPNLTKMTMLVENVDDVEVKEYQVSTQQNGTCLLLPVPSSTFIWFI
jgi:hypothetical protein